MKKIIFIFILLGLSSCQESLEDTTWVIEKTTGETDTIQAKRYWILSRDTLFISFKTTTGGVVYNKDEVISFKEIKN